jgi:hypothetical protein
MQHMHHSLAGYEMAAGTADIEINYMFFIEKNKILQGRSLFDSVICVTERTLLPLRIRNAKCAKLCGSGATIAPGVIPGCYS